MLKNVQTTRQLCPFPTLVKLYSKSFKLGFSSTWIENFQMYKLEKEMATHSTILAWRIPGTEEPGGLPFMGSHGVGHDWSNLAAAPDVQAGFKKGIGTRGQIGKIGWTIEKTRKFQEKYLLLLYWLLSSLCVDHNKLWKILIEMGVPDHLTFLLKCCMQVKNQQLEPDMKQWTGSRSGQESIKAVYCDPNYLTYSKYYMWNAGLDDSKAAIKIARRNINNLRYIDDTTVMAESKED